ncbi:MAG: MFS transporter [Acidobacteria bacterium]|nr:MFS transporter [Acidobacteriota bacterium]MBV9477392.1 MFS transporter [Acidobacteriota bacterium]
MPQYSLRANLHALPRAAWTLFAGAFINRFGTFVMPFLILYLTRHGYSAAQAGLAVSAYGGGHLIAAMLGGHLADSIGRRNTIAFSMFVSCAAMLALSQARAYPAIVAIVLIVGAASEMYRPAAGALIGDLVPREQRVTAFAMFRLANNLGFATGPATAGLLAGHSFFALFIADAATSLLFGSIALTALPHGARTQPNAAHVSGGFRHALRNEPFVIFLLATLCITWIEPQVTSTFPLYLQQSGFSPKTYGFLISLNGALVVLFELALTSWTQRHPPQRILALGYTLFGAGFALIGLAHSIPALVLCVVAWTSGEMIFAPVGGAYASTLAPEQFRGRYQGLYTLTWSAGLLAGPTLGTLLLQSNASAYWVSVAAAGSVGGLLALVRRAA